MIVPTFILSDAITKLLRPRARPPVVRRLVLPTFKSIAALIVTSYILLNAIKTAACGRHRPSVQPVRSSARTSVRHVPPFVRHVRPPVKNTTYDIMNLKDNGAVDVKAKSGAADLDIKSGGN